ncbi:hypothetical protein T261_2460 [Streptomyces lydicus]|nr:hypothetical protein T261_2460 [Streptomyces lydicus]
MTTARMTVSITPPVSATPRRRGRHAPNPDARPPDSVSGRTAPGRAPRPQ